MDSSQPDTRGMTRGAPIARPSLGRSCSTAVQPSRGRVSATSRPFLGRLALDRSCSATSRLSVLGWLPLARSSIGRCLTLTKSCLGHHLAMSRSSLNHHLAMSQPSRSCVSQLSHGCYSANLLYKWPFLCRVCPTTGGPSVRPSPFGQLS